MGVFKGTDDYASIKAVFGPAIEQLEQRLHLTSIGPINTTITLHQQHPHQQQPLATAAVPNARQNNSQYLSDDCEECDALRAAGATQIPIRTTPYTSIRICWVVILW